MHTTLDQLTRLHLYKQGLYHPSDLSTPDDALDLIRRLGCIQLDTMSVVSRSQNLLFWSRMKAFDESWWLDFYEQGKIFELYLHALCILPMEAYPYFHGYRERYLQHIEQEESAEQKRLITEVAETLQQHAPLTSKEVTSLLDITLDKRETWTLTPVRRALDQLWRSGRADVVRNAHFHKVYKRVEDQVPANLSGQKVALPETYLHYTKLALDNIGIATDREIADYFRFKRETVKGALDELLAADEVRVVEVIEDPEPHYILTRDIELLSAPELQEAPTHDTLLSPFDPLVWYRPRTKKMYGVDYRLESYVPQAQRIYGYFAMPILLHGQLVGTVDMKAHRKQKALEISKLVFFDPAAEQVHTPELLPLLERFLNFLDLKDLRPSDAFQKEKRALTKLL
ncbi:MAG TPA: crosslink repair DNA glycosylase YcaQ family protein [Bacilli bacterium]|nr:crosslink repair DNA glycosylase YcaQ family protein [Bacilli bacterium]